MDRDELSGSLRAAVISLHGRLPAPDIDSIWSLIDAGEPGVALENLCTQLDEYEIHVEPELKNQLRAAADLMSLDQSMVDNLLSR